MRSVLCSVVVLAAACGAPEINSAEQNATLAARTVCPPDAEPYCTGAILHLCPGHSARCQIGCHNGACDVCRTGASQCASDGNVATCVDGQWQETACPGGCDPAGPSCRPVAPDLGSVPPLCSDGDTRCGSAHELDTCAGGAWTAKRCVNICFDDGSGARCVPPNTCPCGGPWGHCFRCQ